MGQILACIYWDDWINLILARYFLTFTSSVWFRLLCWLASGWQLAALIYSARTTTRAWWSGRIRWSFMGSGAWLLQGFLIVCLRLRLSSRRDNRIGIILYLLLNVAQVEHRLLLRCGSRSYDFLVRLMRNVLLVQVLSSAGSRGRLTFALGRWLLSVASLGSFRTWTYKSLHLLLRLIFVLMGGSSHNLVLFLSSFTTTCSPRVIICVTPVIILIVAASCCIGWLFSSVILLDEDILNWCFESFISRRFRHTIFMARFVRWLGSVPVDRLHSYIFRLLIWIDRLWLHLDRLLLGH